jgi:hypothetical protein
MLSQWQLWGAFSVLDHLPERAFVSDVLVYDRLIIPVPVEGEDARWVRRDPERQRIFLNVLKDGNPGRVVEIPWNNDHREVRKSRLAAQLAGDASIMRQERNLDTLAQEITRDVLKDYVHERRERIQVLHGCPPQQVNIVAAYRKRDEFEEETGIVEMRGRRSAEDGLLAGFVWPFIVPNEDDRSDLDLLKRAVEFANEPKVQMYREAFHRWRADVILNEKHPHEAADELKESIQAYGEWVRKQKIRTRTQVACAVVAVAASVAGAIVPVVGLPVAGAALGAAGALGPWYNQITSQLFRGQLEAFDSANSPGALFWEWKEAHK